MDSHSVLLSVQNVNKVYRMGEVDVHALRDATLEINDGEFLTVMGPSGSGKSTLLNLIGGMDRPTSGIVKFLDTDLSRSSDAELTRFRRDEVGFVFQFFNLVPSLTALVNVQVAVELVRHPMDALEALKLVGLSDRSDHFPSQLSGGQQQRVAIARALAGHPRLMLCDEPTGALDSETSRQVLEVLQDLQKRLKKTIVVITHDKDIAALGQRMAIITDGRIASVTEREGRAAEAVHEP
jgi:putative ABC transport system ATP-binding protein